MAPKPKAQKMHISEFLGMGGGAGSWADDVETLPTMSSGGGRYDGPLPTGPNRSGDRGFDRPSYGDRGDRGDREDRRDERPRGEIVFPNRPPYTAFIGNLHFEITEDDIHSLFNGLKVSSVRLIKDNDSDRPKGFGYCEFADAESLKSAVSLHGEQVRGRSIRIDVSEPKEGSKPFRDDTDSIDWRRRETPFRPPPPPSSSFRSDDRDRRGGGGGSRGFDDYDRNNDRRGSRDRGGGFGGGFRSGPPGGDRMNSDARDNRGPPAERKRLELKPRTVADENGATSATSQSPSSASVPTASSSSSSKETPSSSAQTVSEKPKSNPFGAAKPRDEAEIQRRLEERQKEKAEAAKRAAEEEAARRKEEAAAREKKLQEEKEKRDREAKEAAAAAEKKKEQHAAAINSAEAGVAANSRGGLASGRGGGRGGMGRGDSSSSRGDGGGFGRGSSASSSLGTERSWRRADDSAAPHIRPPPPPSSSSSTSSGARGGGHSQLQSQSQQPNPQQLRKGPKPVAAPVKLEAPKQIAVANAFALLNDEGDF